MPREGKYSANARKLYKKLKKYPLFPFSSLVDFTQFLREHGFRFGSDRITQSCSKSGYQICVLRPEGNHYRSHYMPVKLDDGNEDDSREKRGKHSLDIRPIRKKFLDLIIHSRPDGHIGNGVRSYDMERVVALGDTMQVPRPDLQQAINQSKEIFGDGYFDCEGPKDAKQRRLAWATWTCMMDACYNGSCIDYDHIGMRGTNVCRDWLCFREFYKWFTGTLYRNAPDLRQIYDIKLRRHELEKDFEPGNCFLDETYYGRESKMPGDMGESRHDDN